MAGEVVGVEGAKCNDLRNENVSSRGGRKRRKGPCMRSRISVHLRLGVCWVRLGNQVMTIDSDVLRRSS